MKAIKVKYIPATNFKGSRLKASDLDGNSITISYPHELNQDEKYWAAAITLIKKMGWYGHWAQGSFKDHDVFVCYDREWETREVRP